MPNPTKYFILNSNGFFINWHSDILGLETEGQALEASGSFNDDSVYVGKNTFVDASRLTQSSGQDSIYLTGNFADYTESNSGPIYTLTKSVNNAIVESLIFTSSNRDILYFADGFINIGRNTLRITQKLSAQTFHTSKTTPDSLDSIPEIAEGGATLAFITDASGANIPSAIKGSKLTVYGSFGSDTVYVAKGTQVNAVSLTQTPGNDVIYLTGNFDDYNESHSGPVYTLVAKDKFDGLTESVTFSASNGDKLYFADGYIEIGRNKLDNGSVALKDAVFKTDKSTPGLGVGIRLTITNDKNINSPVNDDVTYTFIFDQAVTGFELADIVVNDNDVARSANKGTFTAITGESGVVDGTKYTLVVTPETNFEGNLMVSVDKDAATDGSLGSLTANNTQLVDTKNPVAPSITTKSINNAGTVEVTSAEAVTAYLSKDTGAISAASLALEASTSTPTATKISIAANATVNLGATGLTSGTYKVYLVDIAGNISPASNNSITIDALAPTLHATTLPTVTNTGGGVNIDDTLILTITFSENVNGLTSGTDNTIFMLGASGTQATWNGVDGTSARTLTFTISSGDIGAVTINENALKASLLSANIKDTVGNALVVGDIADINDGLTTIADITAPSITSVVITGTKSDDTTVDSNLAVGEKILITITASETLIVTGIPTYKIMIGSNERAASYVSGSNTNILKFSYTITDNDDTTSSISAAENKLITGTNITIKDDAGNDLILNSVPTAIVNTIAVDTAAPTIDKINIEADTKTLILTLSEAVAGAPAISDFVVKSDTNSDPTTLNAVTAVQVNANVITLTLTNIVAHDHNVVMAYTKNSDASKQLQDIAGNAVASDSSTDVNVVGTAQGFMINGEATGDKSGESVSSAGDVNGDGLDDLIVGASGADKGNNTNSGRSYVIFGKSDGVTINLSAIASNTNEQGFVINGENSARSGRFVSGAGDINGDGLDDLIVSDHNDGSLAGKVTVIFGKTNGTAIDNKEIRKNTDTGGFAITGSNFTWGSFVSSAGDVNGDGLDDLIIGNHGTSSDIGKSYVIFGKSDGGEININTIAANDNAQGFVINGISAGDYSGHSVSSAGDVNGDGLDDLIVGAYGINSYSGKSYVVFGKSDGAAIDLNTIKSDTNAQGFVINGEANGDKSGFSVSSAGDVNGDGLDDLIVGATAADSNTVNLTGKSYVVFGKTNGAAINLSAIASGTGGFVINGEANGDQSGYSVSSAGDVNGDGLDDLIVGANGADLNTNSNVGRSYVVFGKTNGAAINLSAIASGTGGFVINGESAKDQNGSSVSSAGDVNGDGLDDLIVGSHGANSNSGKSYVVFGKTNGAAINLSSLTINQNSSVAHAVDFQGDTQTDKNDTLTGTTADELFVAGLGNDTLTGNGGTDVFNAGAGDDTIIINTSNLAKLHSTDLSNYLLARVDGGSGDDILKISGGSLTLDLSIIGDNRIQNIETIDLTGSGDNTIKLNLDDLLDISSTSNILKILGNVGDKVDIDTSTGEFTSTAQKTEDGNTYNVFTHADTHASAVAELWVELGLSTI